MVLITIVTGAYKPTYNWGASHCGGGALWRIGRGKISEIQGNIGLSEEEINGNIPESLGGRVEQRNLLC